MFFRPGDKSIAKDSMDEGKIQQFRDFLEPACFDKPIQKEMSLVSRRNNSYVDNRKITVISNSVIFIKL